MAERDATERVRLMKVTTGLAVAGLEPAVERMRKSAAAGARAARDLRYEAKSSRRESHQRITPVPMPAATLDTDTVPGPPEDEENDVEK